MSKYIKLIFLINNLTNLNFLLLILLIPFYFIIINTIKNSNHFFILKI